MRFPIKTSAEDVDLFAQPVPRHLVHRRSVAEVFPTHWEALGDDSFFVTAQWSLTHTFFVPVAGIWHDPMLIMETLRQAGLLLSHTAFEVPTDYNFLIDTISSHAHPEGLVIDDSPAEIAAYVTCHDAKKRRRAIAGLRMRAELFRGSRTVGAAETTFRCIPPEVYVRIRPARQIDAVDLPEPIPPHLVERERVADVVLAPTDERHAWWLRVDPNHPVMYEHPVDHVPGMAVIEAFRQAAHCLLHPIPVFPVGIEVSFARFVERDAPCLIRARAGNPLPNGDLEVSAVAEQGGRIAVRGRVTTRPRKPSRNGR